MSADVVDGKLKPDGTLTTEHKLTGAASVVMHFEFCDVDIMGESCGPALRTAEAALRRGFLLRPRLYVLLTNVVTSILLVCSLTSQRRVNVDWHDTTTSVDETLSLLVSLMVSSDEKLGGPADGGWGYSSTVVSTCTVARNNKLEFAKLQREQSARDREMEILRSLVKTRRPSPTSEP